MAIMKAWQQTVINQAINILILPLPEDYRTYIRDYRDRLRTKGSANSEISVLLLKDIKDFWYGLIQEAIPDLLKDLFQRIDPNYWTYRIYKPYGYEAIETINNEFQKDFFKINLQSMQISSIALIIFHLVLAVLDIWCLPETRNTAWIIKLFVLTILSISAFLTFKIETFKKYNQQIIIISIVTSALGFILTMNLSHFYEFGQYTYYGALMLLIFYMNLGSGLKFSSVLIASIIILGEYGIANHFIQPIPLNNLLQFLRYLNNTTFLVVSIIIGIFATNLLEHNIRLSFLIRFAIATQFKEFTHYFECHNIKKFHKYIKKIRHSPQILQQFAMEKFDALLVHNVLQSKQNSNPNRKLIIGYNEQISNGLKEEKASNYQNKQEKLKPNHHFVFGIKSFLNHTKYLLKKVTNINLTNQDKDIEKLFLSDYFYASLKTMRLTNIYGIINYGGFTILDRICLPETTSNSDYIRLVFCLISAVAFGITFLEEFFENNHQFMTMIVTSLSTIGIICMTVLSKPTELGYTTYYAGLIQVLFYVFAFSRLLFPNALLVGIFTTISYGIAATCFQNLLVSPEGTSLFINNFFLLIICCTIGSISCHLMEKNARAEFITRYGIALKSKELLAYYESYKPTPQELLEMINQIRHNPAQLQKFLEQNLSRS
jgi:hypothetical protein